MGACSSKMEVVGGATVAPEPRASQGSSNASARGLSPKTTASDRFMAHVSKNSTAEMFLEGAGSAGASPQRQSRKSVRLGDVIEHEFQTPQAKDALARKAMMNKNRQRHLTTQVSGRGRTSEGRRSSGRRSENFAAPSPRSKRVNLNTSIAEAHQQEVEAYDRRMGRRPGVDPTDEDGDGVARAVSGVKTHEELLAEARKRKGGGGRNKSRKDLAGKTSAVSSKSMDLRSGKSQVAMGVLAMKEEFAEKAQARASMAGVTNVTDAVSLRPTLPQRAIESMSRSNVMNSGHADAGLLDDDFLDDLDDGRGGRWATQVVDQDTRNVAMGAIAV
ncbi:unnamed protein product [Pedinophyceae sp. YPF-701]|nr:unnamed protein product [Pedinophyceae sp. YPF-701]